MSMTYPVYGCTQCDLENAGCNAWGQMNYHTSDGPVPVRAHPGWCAACARVQPVEMLPTEARYQKLAMELEIARIEEADLDQKSRLLDGRAWRIERDLSGERDRLRTLRTRRMGPRCLICGSTEVAALPEEPVARYRETSNPPLIATGFRHPGCGGEITIRESDMRINLDPIARMYDTTGREIPRVDPATGLEEVDDEDLSATIKAVRKLMDEALDEEMP